MTITNHRRYYMEHIEDIRQKDPELARVYGHLLDAIDNPQGVDKDELTVKLYGKLNRTTERRLRKAFEVLTNDFGKAVVPLEGGGYSLARSEEEREHGIADHMSRIKAEELRIDALRRAELPPTGKLERVERKEAQQVGLW